ncbi:MAG: ABC transporter permease [Thermoplasmata archaeon]
MTASTAPPVPPLPDGDDVLEADRWRGADRPLYRLALALRTNPGLTAGVTLLAVFGGVAAYALARFGAALEILQVDPSTAQQLPPPGPSWAHPFGIAYESGADVLLAIVQATPIDLALVGGILLAALLVGVVLGGWAGLRGGRIDGTVTFFSDLIAVVPPFFLVLVLFLGIQRAIPPQWGIPSFGILFAFVLWPYYARPVRAMARAVASETYVEAARASGAGGRHVLVRHVLPNSLSPALAQLPVDVYNIFFVLTVFPFLGCFGGGGGGTFDTLTPLPRTTYPEWGALLANGACYGWSPIAGADFWWMYAFPAAVIVVFGAAVALTADGLERHLRRGREGT